MDRLAAGERASADETQRALEAAGTGVPLTDRQRRLVERAKREYDERIRREHYAAVPRKIYQQWAGNRHWHTLGKQLAAVGVTLTSPVDLAALVRALHDHLEAAGRATNDDAKTEWTEKLAAERYALVRLRRRRQESELVDVVDVVAILQTAGEQIRRGVERLEKQYGPEPARILYRAIDAAERAIGRRFDRREDGDAAEP